MFDGNRQINLMSIEYPSEESAWRIWGTWGEEWNKTVSKITKISWIPAPNENGHVHGVNINKLEVKNILWYIVKLKYSSVVSSTLIRPFSVVFYQYTVISFVYEMMLRT